MKLRHLPATIAAVLALGTAACSSPPEVSAFCVIANPVAPDEWVPVDDSYCSTHGNWVPGFYGWHYGGSVLGNGHLHSGYRYQPSGVTLAFRPAGAGGYAPTINKYGGHVIHKTTINNITVNNTKVKTQVAASDRRFRNLSGYKPTRTPYRPTRRR